MTTHGPIVADKEASMNEAALMAQLSGDDPRSSAEQEHAEKRSEMPMPRDLQSFVMTAILMLLVLVILYFSGAVVLPIIFAFLFNLLLQPAMTALIAQARGRYQKLEARERVLSHTIDFPLDGALVLGLGGQFGSGNSVLLVPVGLSLGRRIDLEGSSVSIVPYVQPTGTLVAGSGTSTFLFTLGLGGDFRLSPRFDARVSAGLGDIEGVSLSAVWVH